MFPVEYRCLLPGLHVVFCNIANNRILNYDLIIGDPRAVEAKRCEEVKINLFQEERFSHIEVLVSGNFDAAFVDARNYADGFNAKYISDSATAQLRSVETDGVCNQQQ